MTNILFATFRSESCPWRWMVGGVGQKMLWVEVGRVVKSSEETHPRRERHLAGAPGHLFWLHSADVALKRRVLTLQM